MTLKDFLMKEIDDKTKFSFTYDLKNNLHYNRIFRNIEEFEKVVNKFNSIDLLFDMSVQKDDSFHILSVRNIRMVPGTNLEESFIGIDIWNF